MADTIDIKTPIGTMQVHSANPKMLRKYEKYITDYFSHKKISPRFSDFDIPGTPFQKQVYKALCDVPYGKTISYKDLAKRAGKPKAVRAVATAVAQNQLYIIIPCHRVIRSDGTIGEYGAGQDKKLWLLRHEGAVL